jgi:hypothetical protein
MGDARDSVKEASGIASVVGPGAECPLRRPGERSRAVSERDIPRVSDQLRPRLARHIGVGDAGPKRKVLQCQLPVRANSGAQRP